MATRAITVTVLVTIAAAVLVFAYSSVVRAGTKCSAEGWEFIWQDDTATVHELNDGKIGHTTNYDCSASRVSPASVDCRYFHPTYDAFNAVALKSDKNALGEQLIIKVGGSRRNDTAFVSAYWARCSKF